MPPERALHRDDRRSEPRFPVNGRVVLHVTDPLETEINGQLLDVSRNGFRARHSCRDLHSGQTVGFRHDGKSGRARVVWNRIDSDQVESGFFVL